MLEREAVRSTISGLLGAAEGGRGGALFVLGEAGIGKTSVLDDACRAAASAGRGFATGRATGDVMESSLAFGLAAEALQRLGAANVLDRAARAETPPNVRGATFFRVLDALAARARVRPVLLAVDDIHWADEDSLALLAFLCRRIGDLPVAVIATLRPWPRQAHDAVLGLAAQGHASATHLGPLGPAAAAELLATAAGRPVPPDEVARALALCAGNPLLLEHLALAVRRGDVDLASAEAAGSNAPPTLLLPRFAGLAPAGFRCAQAASVLGIRFRPQVAAEVALLDEAGEHEALAALSGTGLVRPSPEDPRLAEFAHPLLAQVLYRDLEAPLRAVLHRRAFLALARRGLDAPAAEHAVRAHLVGDETAVALIEKVGRRALRAGAVAGATRLLQASVDLAGAGASDGALLTLATALVDAGRPAEAIDAARRVLGRDNAGPAGPTADPATNAAALRILGHAHYAAGDHDLAAASFDEAVRLAEVDKPRLAVEALLLHSVLLALTAGPAPCLPLTVRARRISARAGDALARRAEGIWGYVAVLAGEAAGFEAAGAAATALEAQARVVAPREAWRDITMYGAAAKYGERFDESERLYRLLGAAAELAESPAAVAALCTGHAETLVRVGRLDDALALAVRACDVAEMATHVTATLAAATMAEVLLLVGRLEESDEWCDRAEAMATSGRGEWLPLLRIWDLRGRRRLRQGRVAEAAELYGRSVALTAQVELGEPCVVPWAGHAIAAFARSRRLDEAAGVIAWLERCSDALPCRWPRLAAAAGHALLDERAGNLDVAEAGFRRALDLHDHVDLPLDRAETLVAYGAFLRRRGRLVAARPPLTEALRVAEAAGAAWLVTEAGHELALAGGRRRRATGDPDALTPSEDRVARLAAGGASNRDIAAQLLLSVNTVESHLRRVYAKLGIRSRRDLIVKFATWDGDDPR